MAKSKKRSRPTKKMQELVESLPKHIDEIEESTNEKKKKEEIPLKGSKILDPDHLLAIETMQRDVENAKLLTMVEEQALRNSALELELLKVKIEKQRARVQAKAKEYELAEKKYNDFRSNIFTIYDLPGDKFGYNTMTGEIILD